MDEQAEAVGHALRGWRSALGPEAVATHPEDLTARQLNTSEYPARDLHTILRPRSLDDVHAVIAVARETGVPIHPVSSGRNWGFGSALPVRGPLALVDLAGMNRIIDVDEALRYAVIEPGVLQGQLSDHLLAHGGRLKLNVTGSGRDTSIVGNVLDRGAGNLGPRIEDLLGLEAVLGNGAVVRTGLWNLAEHPPHGHYYPPGLGPDLRNLFVQSNVGVVTKMIVRLHRVTALTEITCEATDEQLPGLIDALNLAHDDAVINGNIRITDGTDQNIRFFHESGPSRWKCQMTVRGTTAMRAAAEHELNRRLTPLVSRLDCFDTERDSRHAPHRTETAPSPQDRHFLDVRLDLANGIPSDRSLQAIAASRGRPATAGRAGGTDLDQDRDLPGFLCANVALPFTGAQVSACATAVRQTAQDMNVQVSRSFAMLGPRAMSGFFPLYFNRRDPAQAERAHAFKRRLLHTLEGMHIHPMRMDIDWMEPFITRHDNDFWNTVTAIKTALDPQNIISPAHYCPTHPKPPKTPHNDQANHHAPTTSPTT
ncbi:FAD-binding oxidoreductase [Streptomyces sp. NPDC102473]|uniref:FAD-binding oxidoreductase n=1 Tax=Streptomyces sp. NPDC102473 TaxID=3366180 RepID=UPI0037F41CAD